MASYFYIVPFKNKDFFKLGISSGKKENLLNRFSQHRNGFESEGIQIDAEKIEYIEFKNSVAAGFIEREMKKKYEYSKICNYGSTETFSLDLLPTVKKEVAQFSLNYGGSDFQNSENRSHSRAPKKIFSYEELRLKNEKKIQSNFLFDMKLKTDLEIHNIEAFNAFSNWFESIKSIITMSSNEGEVTVRMDLRGLELGYDVDPSGCDLVCFLDGNYDSCLEPVNWGCHVGFYAFIKDSFLKIYNSRPDLWELLPIEIRNAVLL